MVMVIVLVGSVKLKYSKDYNFCYWNDSSKRKVLIGKGVILYLGAISRHRRPTVCGGRLSSDTFSFYQSAHKKFIWTIT